MGKPKPRIDEELVLVAFAFTQVVLVFLLPNIWHISINLWSQLLAYVGAFLLGVQVLGEKRTRGADRKLVDNARHISQVLNKTLMVYYLIREEEDGDRKEMATWYLLGLLELLLLIVLITITLPALFGIAPKEFTERYSRLVIWCFVAAVALPYIPFMLWLLLVCRRPGSTSLRKMLVGFTKTASAPGLLLAGWVVIPWLLIVGLTWLVLQTLVGVVTLRDKWRLGNVFYVLGFVCLLLSFAFFVVERVRHGS